MSSKQKKPPFRLLTEWAEGLPERSIAVTLKGGRIEVVAIRGTVVVARADSPAKVNVMNALQRCAFHVLALLGAKPVTPVEPMAAPEVVRRRPLRKASETEGMH